MYLMEKEPIDILREEPIHFGDSRGSEVYPSELQDALRDAGEGPKDVWPNELLVRYKYVLLMLSTGLAAYFGPSVL